jgi:hypothetical protein
MPTLFGVAYAARLFREVDNPSSFGHLLQLTAPAINLQNPAHAWALLSWLNKWRCRIAGNLFPALSMSLSHWHQQWGPQLPQPHVELVNLEDADLDILVAAYEVLPGVRGLGPTAAAKVLFALHPETAIAWDEQIRVEFNVGEKRQGYRDMLVHSKHEAEMLIADAGRCGIGDPQDIPGIVGSPDRTLARLLDEYNWITITSGHQVPTCSELKQWVTWAC